jgi:hypothetical protein
MSRPGLLMRVYKNLTPHGTLGDGLRQLNQTSLETMTSFKNS